MINISMKLISKEWVNLNPRTDPKSIDLYFNERLSLFSLSPIFEKNALPDLYELFSKHFRLKLQLPFLQSHPDFLQEYSKLTFIEQQLKKPLELEEYVENQVFFERMSMILDENYQEELNLQRTEKFFNEKNNKSNYFIKENHKRNYLEKGSDPTIVDYPVLKASNFKENTLKLRNKFEKRPLKEDLPKEMIPFEKLFEKIKKNLIGNCSFEDLQKYRIEDPELTKNFDDLNKNEVALFYEICQKVHKIKPMFTYTTMQNHDNKSLGKLTLGGKPMLQVLESCKKEAKKTLCNLALEIFCPFVWNSQVSLKRKSHQVKGLMIPLLKPKKKKVKTSEESPKNQIQTLEEKKTIPEEKKKNPLDFMKNFENINKILGTTHEPEPNIEQKETLATLEADKFAEDEPFYPFLLDLFPETRENELNFSIFDEPIKFKDKEREIGEVRPLNNFFETQNKPITNQFNPKPKAINMAIPQVNANFIQNNNANFVQLNAFPQNNNNQIFPQSSNFLQNGNFTKPNPVYPSFPHFPSNFHQSQKLNKASNSNKYHNSKGNYKGSDRNYEKEANYNDKGLYHKEKEKGKKVEKFHFVTKEEEELEEEMKRLCGKKVIYLDDFLKDMGNAQKNYPINLANEFLEKLLRLQALKNEESLKVFTIKDKGIIRVSIKHDEKGEVCFARNENNSFAKYFCLIDFFKLKYGSKSTVNEILVQLLKKNQRILQKTTMTTSALTTTTSAIKPVNLNNKEGKKTQNKEICGLLDDIDSFQYSLNTINNRKKGEEKGHLNDTDEDIEENENEESAENKRNEENLKKKENNSKKREENPRMHSSSQRDKEKNRNDDSRNQGKHREEQILEKAKDKESPEEIIFIE